MAKPLQIFRPGRHTDMRGKTIEFSAADLEACANAYDPKLHEAPIVVGHPQTDSPAYGWVKSLAFAGTLDAEPQQVAAEFAEAIAAGRYKKISASFYLPGSQANPTPGTYYLKHVGFLGGAAPAVQGLRAAEFAGGDDDCTTVEFSEYGDRNVATLLRSMRDWIIGKFGQDEADKALPGWGVDSVQEDAAQEVAKAAGFSEATESAVLDGTGTETPVADGRDVLQPPAEYSAPETPASDDPTDDEREAAVKERERKLQEREAAFAARELASKHASHSEFLDRLVAQGRALPCPKATMVSFMQLLDGEGSVSFGEGEERSPLDLFKAEVLGRLPKTIDFSERAGGDDDLVTDDPRVVAQAAAEYAAEQLKAGRFVTATEAVRHVTKGR